MCQHLSLGQHTCSVSVKMAPKKGRKGPAKASKRDEEERVQAEREERERQIDDVNLDMGAEGDADDGSECSGGSETGKRKDQKSYNFGAADENRLVEFFEANDCFYNKLNEKYANTQHKNRLLKEISADLFCEPSKIIGWFKNQRTAIGKLLKKKSGQAAQSPTSRSKWQLSAFQFLSDHIRPRTYLHDTGMPEDDDEPGDVLMETVVPVSEPETLAASTSSVTRGMKRARTTVTKMDEALLKFLSQPRESHQIVKKLEESAGPQGERETFSNWFKTRLHKVPEQRWDDFTDDVMLLLRRYTSKPCSQQPPTQPQTQWTISSQSSLSRPQDCLQLPQQQQQWAVPQQRQFWPQQSQSQSQQPSPQQQQQQQQQPWPQLQQWTQQQAVAVPMSEAPQRTCQSSEGQYTANIPSINSTLLTDILPITGPSSEASRMTTAPEPPRPDEEKE